MESRTITMLKYVQFIGRRLDKQDVRSVTLLILLDLNFAPGNEGFVYLRSAIERQRASDVPIVIKRIYPTISGVDDMSSWHYVDQAIRRAIKAAWDDRDPELWYIFFPPGGSRISRCPSNKEFIARIACIIELWQSCKEVDYERTM